MNRCRAFLKDLILLEKFVNGSVHSGIMLYMYLNLCIWKILLKSLYFSAKQCTPGKFMSGKSLGISGFLG